MATSPPRIHGFRCDIPGRCCPAGATRNRLHEDTSHDSKSSLEPCAVELPGQLSRGCTRTAEPSCQRSCDKSITFDRLSVGRPAIERNAALTYARFPGRLGAPIAPARCDPARAARLRRFSLTPLRPPADACRSTTPGSRFHVCSSHLAQSQSPSGSTATYLWLNLVPAFRIDASNVIRLRTVIEPFIGSSAIGLTVSKHVSSFRLLRS